MNQSKTPRSKAYLAWLRTQPCCISGYTEHVQAAHVRLGNGGGMGLKPSDFRALPIADSYHRYQHSVGEISFWSEYRKDPDVEVIAHLCRYIDDPKEIIRALEAHLIDREACGGERT